MTEFIFTFGFGQTDPKTGASRSGCFVRIAADTWESARREMAYRYGRQWAFQYESEDEAGVREFDLREIVLPAAIDSAVAL